MFLLQTGTIHCSRFRSFQILWELVRWHVLMFSVSSVLWCLLQFQRKNEVLFVFSHKFWRTRVFFYVACACLHILVSSTSWLYGKHGRNSLPFASTWFHPGIFLWVRTAHLFSFLCCVVVCCVFLFCFCSFCVFVFPMLQVSLSCLISGFLWHLLIGRN